MVLELDDSSYKVAFKTFRQQQGYFGCTFIRMLRYSRRFKLLLQHVILFSLHNIALYSKSSFK